MKEIFWTDFGSALRLFETFKGITPKSLSILATSVILLTDSLKLHLNSSVEQADDSTSFLWQPSRFTRTTSNFRYIISLFVSLRPSPSLVPLRPTLFRYNQKPKMLVMNRKWGPYTEFLDTFNISDSPKPGKLNLTAWAKKISGFAISTSVRTVHTTHRADTTKQKAAREITLRGLMHRPGLSTVHHGLPKSSFCRPKN